MLTRALIKIFSKALRRADKAHRKVIYDFLVKVFVEVQPSFNKEMFARESGVIK